MYQVKFKTENMVMSESRRRRYPSLSVVKLESLNHKINRKGALEREERMTFENWNDHGCSMEPWIAAGEAFDETVATPVGGYVRRYI